MPLALTGGETARRALDALGVNRLPPVGQVHHGAVHTLTPSGRSVVIRPGSFGGPESLVDIVQSLQSLQPLPPRSAAVPPHPTGPDPTERRDP